VSAGWICFSSPSTGGYGEPAGFEFTWFEPLARITFGRLKKANNLMEQSYDVTFFELGTRAYLSIPLGSSLALRLGGEVAYVTLDWRSYAAPGTTATFGGSQLRLATFASLGWVLVNSR